MRAPSLCTAEGLASTEIPPRPASRPSPPQLILCCSPAHLRWGQWARGSGCSMQRRGAHLQRGLRGLLLLLRMSGLLAESLCLCRLLLKLPPRRFELGLLGLGCKAKRARMPANGTRPQEASSRAPPWVLASALCASRSSTCFFKVLLSFSRSLTCAADERMAPSAKLRSARTARTKRTS